MAVPGRVAVVVRLLRSDDSKNGLRVLPIQFGRVGPMTAMYSIAAPLLNRRVVIVPSLPERIISASTRDLASSVAGVVGAAIFARLCIRSGAAIRPRAPAGHD